MKIYILADMEGISGIRMYEQTDKTHAEYAQGRQLMMAEVNVAVDAAFAAGATEVVVCDTHAGGGQLLLDQMDERAIYETPNAGRLMPALDETFDGVILLGHHAKAGTLDGFLDHTMNSRKWFEYRINDVVVGEIGIEAAFAGHFGVPVIMVVGDEKTRQEAQQTLGEVTTVVVKWGIGRNRARCLSLPKAHALVREGVEKAVANASSYKPYQPDLPATLQLTFYRSDDVDGMTNIQDVERIDGRTLRRRITELSQVCRWWA